MASKLHSQCLTITGFRESDEIYSEMLKFCKKEDFVSDQLQSLTEGEWSRLKDFGGSFLINLTPKCNSRCNICFMKEFRFDDMEKPDMEFILSKVGRNKKIILWGGEPTTRKDLFEIIEIIKKSGNFAVVYTNGLKLSDQGYVRSLKNAGVDYVILSFDGFNPEIYKKLRGDSGQLFLKIKALENLKKRGILTHISFTLANGINNSEVGKVLDFSIKNNDFIKFMTIYPATPMGRFELEVENLVDTEKIMEILGDSNSKLSESYLYELKEFYYNLEEFFSRFNINLGERRLFPEILLRVEKKGVRPLIPKEDLAGINRNLKEKRFLGLFRYGVKYSGLLIEFLKSSMNQVKFENALFKRNLFGLLIGGIKTPHQGSYNKKVKSVALMKVDGEIVEVAVTS